MFPCYNIETLWPRFRSKASISQTEMQVHVRPETPVQTVYAIFVIYFVTADCLATAAAGWDGVVLEALWASALSSCELTSKKWYSTINIMATEPRKIASLYRSSSEIIVFRSRSCLDISLNGLNMHRDGECGREGLSVLNKIVSFPG